MSLIGGNEGSSGGSGGGWGAVGNGAMTPLANFLGGMMTYNSNKRAANKARDWEEYMWHKQNAYNSPEAQMARLKAAGLNPNLVYGNGSVANQAGSTHGVSQQGANFQFDNPIAAYQDARIQNAQLSAIAANQRLTEMNIAGKAISNARQTIGLQGDKDLYPTNMEAARTALKRSLQQYDWQAQENQYQPTRNRLDQRSRELGNISQEITNSNLDRTQKTNILKTLSDINVATQNILESKSRTKKMDLERELLKMDKVLRDNNINPNAGTGILVMDYLRRKIMGAPKQFHDNVNKIAKKMRWHR